MEELGELQSTGRKESDTTERLHFHFQDPPNLASFDTFVWLVAQPQVDCHSKGKELTFVKLSIR